MTRIFILPLLLLLPKLAFAQGGIQLMDKHVFYMLDVEELELTTFGDSHDYAWDADFWAGTDLNRLWIKTKGEAAAGGNDHAELQILYSRAIAPFWNLQAGVRHESEPKPEITAYSTSDVSRGLGSGLGRIELGLRLRYEYRREFAPYIGLYRVSLRGQTGDLAVSGGHKADDVELVAGVRFWY